jgi:hypothetical protein
VDFLTVVTHITWVAAAVYRVPEAPEATQNYLIRQFGDISGDTNPKHPAIGDYIRIKLLDHWVQRSGRSGMPMWGPDSPHSRPAIHMACQLPSHPTLGNMIQFYTGSTFIIDRATTKYGVT